MGNNYETTQILIQKINELNLDLENKWFSIKAEIIENLFKENKFSVINISFRIDSKQTKEIIKQLNILNLEYKEIEENQQKANLLTNSEMDILIYKSWEDYTSFAPFLYGEIQEREIENKRKLIQNSIEFYKNK